MTAIAERRARATDPITSHMAAERAGQFAGPHKERILWALAGALDDGMTAAEIAAASGLTVVQVARRMPELLSDQEVYVVETEDGRDLVRNGYRVWRAS